MNINPLDFVKSKFEIHIRTREQLNIVLDYYKDLGLVEHHTIDEGNFETYPYMFYDKYGSKSIHGRMMPSSDNTKSVEFDDWYDSAFNLPDLPESNYELEFLWG